MRLSINMSTLLSLRLKGNANYKNWSHFSLAGYVKPKYVCWCFNNGSVLSGWSHNGKSSPVCPLPQCTGCHLCESWSGWSIWSCGIRVGHSTRNLHQLGWSCISAPWAEPESGSQYSRRCYGYIDLQVWTIFMFFLFFYMQTDMLFGGNKDQNVRMVQLSWYHNEEKNVSIIWMKFLERKH